MKTLLAFLFLATLTVTARAATSPYAGQYFGASYSNGQIVAGVNITIGSNGGITGRGAYVNLVQTTITGKVDASGKVTVTERSNGHQSSYTATFTTNGKKFVAQLSTGNVFKGKKLVTAFKQAGVYSATTDFGETGVFLLDRNGSLYGVIYDADGDAFEVDGFANQQGFSGMTEDGVSFEGGFNGTQIFGTYSDGMGFEGTFSGARY